jgi:hypothetical protein
VWSAQCLSRYCRCLGGEWERGELRAQRRIKRSEKYLRRNFEWETGHGVENGVELALKAFIAPSVLQQLPLQIDFGIDNAGTEWAFWSLDALGVLSCHRQRSHARGIICPLESPELELGGPGFRRMALRGLSVPETNGTRQ